MSAADQVSILLDWCDTNSISIESIVRVDGDEQGGIGVFSADDFIPPNTTCEYSAASVFFTTNDNATSGQDTQNLYLISADLLVSWRYSF